MVNTNRDALRDALLEYFSRRGQSRSPEELAPDTSAGRMKELGPDPLEWVALLSCLKRVRKWRVPPGWSDREWFEEVGADATVAALQATIDFEPAWGVPWEIFLRRRVTHSLLGRYRREWSYAIRQVSRAALDEYRTTGRAQRASREPIARLLQEALRQLPQLDAWLIEGLFWEGKSEANLAECLGISQQAVNKRKWSIFKTLHRLIDNLAKDLDAEL